MSNSDVDFVIAVVEKVKESGQPFSRDLLRDCYLEDLKRRGVNELSLVSEKWIDHYWTHLEGVAFDRIEKAAASPPRLAKLLIEVLGK